jgi:hypothetical protein
MTTLDILFAALERSPDDWVARAALADCYEEAGLIATASCLRWMLKGRIRPSRRLSGGAMWFNGRRPCMEYTDQYAYLPVELFVWLREGEGFDGHVQFYDRPRDAEEDLFAAWAAAGRAGRWRQ